MPEPPPSGGSRRRGAGWLVGAVAASTVTSILPGFVPRPAGAEAKPPNVLIIVTDDQRESGTLRRKVLPATLRWFRDGGTRFAPAYATDPLCCPSRASIFSGRYPHNHGVLKNSSGSAGTGALDHDNTVQRLLRQGGYRTGMMGKFLNRWDVNVPPPHFDDFALMGGSGGYRDERFNLNGDIRRIHKYSTKFIAERSVRFIDRAEQDDADPWFLYVAPYAPHPSPEADAVQAKYRDAPIAKWNGNPAVDERNRGDKPRYVRKWDTTLRAAQARRAHQLRLLMSLDDLVRDVLTAMGRNGERRNTLAFFISDNGFLWGEHGLLGKGTPYTPSIRVPLFMLWPAGGVAAGAKDARVASNVDLAPTIYHATGLVAGYEVDGRSLFNEWTRDRMFMESWPSTGSPAPRWASIRTAAYHYIEYYDAEGNVTFREYYKLGSDPWQLHNVLATAGPGEEPAHLPLVQAQLAADSVCSGTTGPGACP